jgi:hypothetical protein
MKNLLLLLLIVFTTSTSFSQTTNNNVHFFGQCMVSSLENQELIDLEQHLKQNPYVQVVRVDLVSKRVFILTKDISSYTMNDFKSWLGEKENAATCIQVGLHGIDLVNPFPFTNCNN